MFLSSSSGMSWSARNGMWEAFKAELTTTVAKGADASEQCRAMYSDAFISVKETGGMTAESFGH